MIQLCCPRVFALQVSALEPGRTYRVDRIVFSGNHAFPASELLAHMTTRQRPFYLIWQKRPVFDSDVFSQDLKRLQLFYRANGYFQTRIAYDLKVKDGLITPGHQDHRETVLQGPPDQDNRQPPSPPAH